MCWSPPKAHAENLYELDDAQAAALLRAAARVARAIRDAFDPQGLSVYQANGKRGLADACSITTCIFCRATKATA